MAHEIAIDKKVMTLKVDAEDYVKIRRAYGTAKESDLKVFCRALHELAKDLPITASDLKVVKKIREENLAKRQLKRIAEAQKRGDTTVGILAADGKIVRRRGRRPAYR